jgi:hypothetical protein
MVSFGFDDEGSIPRQQHISPLPTWCRKAAPSLATPVAIAPQTHEKGQRC